MSSIANDILASPIQMADQVIKLADEAQASKLECLELKAKTEKLVALLRQAARASNDLYERPTRRIIDDVEQVLEKALQLIEKCCGNGFMKRLFTIITPAAFRKTSTQLDNSLGDVQWLLRVSVPADQRDDDYLGGLPPIASNEPILCLIWEQIAILLTGSSMEDRSDAAASLVSLARDNDRYNKLIIEEGGVPPLLKLLKEGHVEGQESAARAIGLLGNDPESVEHIVNAGVCTVFAKVLKEGDMKVQAMVAWAISELAYHHPKCQDHFAQTNCIRLLVRHLAFETIQEHSKYAITSKQNMSSIHSVLMASNAQNQDDHDKKTMMMHEGNYHYVTCPMGNQSSSQMSNVVTNTMAVNHGHGHGGGNNSSKHVSIAGTSLKGREAVDPVTKAQMKAMAAKALWQLSRGNVTVCHSITESKALLCFAVLLEKGPDDVKSFSAFALMEITAVAEQHAELRRSAFKPNSPAAKAVVDQFVRIISKMEFDLLIPCIKSIGNLARTFRATETRIIPPLVALLEEGVDEDVRVESTIALVKFACPDNFLHQTHCSAIIEAGGVPHITNMIFLAGHAGRIAVAQLLCYVVIHVPKSEALTQDREVLRALEWCMVLEQQLMPIVGELLDEANGILTLYQTRDATR
ncbi:hypothetical protein K1719_000663 [Acacia pycnantha]|nr:hypothetical protein K1719_000663 [Acacia pycnantha]